MNTYNIDRKSRRFLGCLTLALLAGPALSTAFAQSQQTPTDTGGGPESSAGQTNALPLRNTNAQTNSGQNGFSGAGPTGTPASLANSGSDTGAMSPTDTSSQAGTSAMTPTDTSSAAGTSSMTSTDTSSEANTAGQASLSHADRHFMMKAAWASTNEVALSQLAADHASNSAVKDFAQMMITDHTKANNDLQALASQKGVDISKAVEKGQIDDVQSLSDKTGADFDQAYTKKMISAHEEAVSLFRKEASDGTDPDVVAFANKYLPVLSGHYEHAKQLKQTLDGTQ